MSRYTDAEWKAICAARREMNPEVDRKDVHGNHVAYDCHCGRSSCMFCDGGLLACDVCGSFEGATTTDCPGRKIHDTDAVYAGRLDYRNGNWVAGPSLHTPALFVLACERAGVKP